MPGNGNKNDSTHHMLNRNDKLKEQHVQQLKRIIAEQQRMSETLTKQIKDLRVEIKDLCAYNAVYQEFSLQHQDSFRKPRSYTNILLENPVKTEQTTSHSTQKHKQRVKSLKPDPFRLENCWMDVEHDLQADVTLPTSSASAATSLPKLEAMSPLVNVNSTRRRVKSSKQLNSSQYESVLPGNCTNYYSIRKFYEIEKEKLLKQRSPEQRRKRTVKLILSKQKTLV